MSYLSTLERLYTDLPTPFFKERTQKREHKFKWKDH
jgi:hypothetical protein